MTREVRQAGSDSTERPYVNCAAFCENILSEKDNIVSAIRFIDQLTVQAIGEDAPSELPEGTAIQAKLLIILRAGQALGSQRLKMDVTHPDTGRDELPEVAVNFPAGEAGGLNLIVPVTLVVRSAGVHWFALYVNDRLMTRVPLDIKYGFTRGPALRPS